MALGVFVKPLLASIGVKIIGFALILAGSASLSSRLLSHRQAACRVLGHFWCGRGLGGAYLRLVSRARVWFGRKALRPLVKLLLARIRAEIIGLVFISAQEAGSLCLTLRDPW